MGSSYASKFLTPFCDVVQFVWVGRLVTFVMVDECLGDSDMLCMVGWI